MASIEIIIRDDKGRLLGTKYYDLPRRSSTSEAAASTRSRVLSKP
jgi:hypothetical protein